MATAIYRDSVPSGATKITFSAWVKRCGLASGSHQQLFSAYTSNDRRAKVYITSDSLRVWEKDSSGNEGYVTTTRLFRDINSWYHIVVAQDNTLATAADRIKIYINGVRETAVTWVDSYPTQDSTTWILGHGKVMHGNGYYNGSYESQSLNGLMSAINVCYGNAYDASYFGSVDSTTGQWKINTSPSVTYGTQGYSILNNGNTITDQSDNSNNFSLGQGTLTDTKDCPSNVFATMNSLANTVAPVGLTQGNNTVAMTNSKGGILSTIACTGGKYYAEMKIATAPQDFRFHWGILPKPISAADDPINGTNAGIMLSGFNAALYAGGGVINNFYGNATGRFSGNPILGLAIDLESATKTIAISVNGAWITGSNTTDASFSNALKVDITSYVAAYDDWFIGCGSGNSSGTTGVYNINFGNGTFGTSTVSSAGTAGSTPGTFEYDVPSGYEPLSTKGLNA